MEAPVLGEAEKPIDVRGLVEPDRVHRWCYVDQQIFEAELDRIFHRTWIYIGHESQVKKPGDYATTAVGQQPVIMVRGKDRKVHVLYNRCPHRGALMCSDRQGNAGEAFRCTYHAWQFNLDGSVESIPVVKGYDNTRFDINDPQFRMKAAARVASYRGFVFARLTDGGPDLETFLGGAKAAFDDMCDRAPDGEVEIVPTCFRMIQKSNWKIFLENQLDSLHPSVTHESAGRAARAVEGEIEQRTGKKAPLSYHYVSAFAMGIEFFDNKQIRGYPYGHCMSSGYMSLRPKDPDTVAYEKIMYKRYGEKRAEEILGNSIHHVLVYPCLSVQSPLQQLRAVRPIAPDRTMTEIWHFRLKGAPEPIYRRALDYFYLVNSPSTMINADDLHNFWKCHEGLKTQAHDWVSFHRNAGQDTVENGITRSITGMSEQPMRNMFRAWTDYLGGRA
jgi:phenylpropionate dioxygenase-like ring-hydroxylating dioxygenase large terminal subunit